MRVKRSGNVQRHDLEPAETGDGGRHSQHQPRPRVRIDIEGNVFLAHEFLDEMCENW